MDQIVPDKAAPHISIICCLIFSLVASCLSHINQILNLAAGLQNIDMRREILLEGPDHKSIISNLYLVVRFYLW